VAATAPTLQRILFDAHNAGELNGHIVELAAACPKDTVQTDTKTLFTAAGIGALERYMSTFSAWAGSDAVLDLHIRRRVAKLIDRVAAHTNSGADTRCARRVNPAAPDTSHPPAAPCSPRRTPTA